MDETNTNFSMPVMPAYGGGYGNNGGFGFGGDGWWILLLILLCGNGWGNGFGGGNGAVPFMMGADMSGGFGMYPWMTTNQNINGGFRDQMTHDAITSIGDKITSGFGDVATQLCGGFAGTTAAVTGAQNAISQQLYANQLADLERSFAAQTANTQGLTTLQSQLAQCCCDNRAATADLKYTIATEACNDRAAVSQGIQTIMDKLCALELDGVKGQLAQAQRDNVALQNQLNMAALRESQTAQNAFIANGFANEVDQLYNRLNSCPVPTTPVYGRTPIFTCGGNSVGCGCGGNGFVN